MVDSSDEEGQWKGKSNYNRGNRGYKGKRGYRKGYRGNRGKRPYRGNRGNNQETYKWSKVEKK